MPWLLSERVWNGHGYDTIPGRRRWVNDFPLKRLTLPCLAKVIRDYWEARSVGYKVDDAIAYSMACKESTWHSGWTPSLKKKATDNKWWHTSRVAKQYTRERFVKVVANSLGRDEITMRKLALDKSVVFKDHMIREVMEDGVPTVQRLVVKLFNWDSRRGKKARKAMRQYWHIAGQEPRNEWQWLTNKELKEWSMVKRGRDLFVKGWGSFDIQGVVAANVRWYPDSPQPPHFVSARGYGIRQPHYFKEVMESPFLTEYCTRWLDWFRTPMDHVHGDMLGWSVLDEFVQIGPRHDDDDRPRLEIDKHPETALREYRAYMNDLYGRYNDKTPIEDEWPWVREKGSIQNTSEGVLYPIDTHQKLKEISSELDNCAATYAGQIQRKERMLVVLIRDGKAVALGEFNSLGEMYQLSGLHNRGVPAEVRKVYESYKPVWKK
jgi:hypothetical protein